MEGGTVGEAALPATLVEERPLPSPTEPPDLMGIRRLAAANAAASAGLAAGSLAAARTFAALPPPLVVAGGLIVGAGDAEAAGEGATLSCVGCATAGGGTAGVAKETAALGEAKRGDASDDAAEAEGAKRVGEAAAVAAAGAGAGAEPKPPPESEDLIGIRRLAAAKAAASAGLAAGSLAAARTFAAAPLPPPPPLAGEVAAESGEATAEEADVPFCNCDSVTGAVVAAVYAGFALLGAGASATFVAGAFAGGAANGASSGEISEPDDRSKSDIGGVLQILSYVFCLRVCALVGND